MYGLFHRRKRVFLLFAGGVVGPTQVLTMCRGKVDEKIGQITGRYDKYEGCLRPGSLFPTSDEFKYLPIAKNQDHKV